jgi:hypothetical protein
VDAMCTGRTNSTPLDARFWKRWTSVPFSYIAINTVRPAPIRCQARHFKVGASAYPRIHITYYYD